MTRVADKGGEELSSLHAGMLRVATTAPSSTASGDIHKDLEEDWPARVDSEQLYWTPRGAAH